MAIVVNASKWDEATQKRIPYSYVEYVGRVLSVRECTENRNHSDTLDYSDYRSAACKYALVWRGPVGKVWPEKEERALTPLEQFVEVDCTNLFVWRGGSERLPTVDADLEADEPMRTAYAAYLVAKEEARVRYEAELAAKRAALKAEQDKKDARAAKRLAKAQAEVAAAQKVLDGIFALGTQVKVGNFVGKLFWKGTRMGKPRVGVKNAKGEVAWGNPEEVSAV